MNELDSTYLNKYIFHNHFSVYTIRIGPRLLDMDRNIYTCLLINNQAYCARAVHDMCCFECENRLWQLKRLR